MSEDLYKEGLATRRAVLGAEYVDRSMQAADEFMMPFQRLTTEWCWGYIWNRPGLSRRDRSLLNIGMLTALGKPAELALHARGALTNGLTVSEIQEALLQATIYCGIPAGLEAFRTVSGVLNAAADPAKQESRREATQPLGPQS